MYEQKPTIHMGSRPNMEIKPDMYFRIGYLYRNPNQPDNQLNILSLWLYPHQFVAAYWRSIVKFTSQSVFCRHISWDLMMEAEYSLEMELSRNFLSQLLPMRVMTVH